jgi:hypothetical protein
MIQPEAEGNDYGACSIKTYSREATGFRVMAHPASCDWTLITNVGRLPIPDVKVLKRTLRDVGREGLGE